MTIRFVYTCYILVWCFETELVRCGTFFFLSFSRLINPDFGFQAKDFSYAITKSRIIFIQELPKYYLLRQMKRSLQNEHSHIFQYSQIFLKQLHNDFHTYMMTFLGIHIQFQDDLFINDSSIMNHFHRWNNKCTKSIPIFINFRNFFLINYAIILILHDWNF